MEDSDVKKNKFDNKMGILFLLIAVFVCGQCYQKHFFTDRNQESELPNILEGISIMYNDPYPQSPYVSKFIAAKLLRDGTRICSTRSIFLSLRDTFVCNNEITLSKSDVYGSPVESQILTVHKYTLTVGNVVFSQICPTTSGEYCHLDHVYKNSLKIVALTGEDYSLEAIQRQLASEEN